MAATRATQWCQNCFAGWNWAFLQRYVYIVCLCSWEGGGYNLVGSFTMPGGIGGAISVGVVMMHAPQKALWEVGNGTNFCAGPVAAPQVPGRVANSGSTGASRAVEERRAGHLLCTLSVYYVHYGLGVPLWCWSRISLPIPEAVRAQLHRCKQDTWGVAEKGWGDWFSFARGVCCSWALGSPFQNSLSWMLSTNRALAMLFWILSKVSKWHPLNLGFSWHGKKWQALRFLGWGHGPQDLFLPKIFPGDFRAVRHEVLHFCNSQMRNACRYACHLLDPINDFPIKSLPEFLLGGTNCLLAVKETSDCEWATVKVKKKHAFQFAHFRSLVTGWFTLCCPWLLNLASRSF